jgi:hypothetical protein
MKNFINDRAAGAHQPLRNSILSRILPRPSAATDDGTINVLSQGLNKRGALEKCTLQVFFGMDQYDTLVRQAVSSQDRAVPGWPEDQS